MNRTYLSFFLILFAFSLHAQNNHAKKISCMTLIQLSIFLLQVHIIMSMAL